MIRTLLFALRNTQFTSKNSHFDFVDSWQLLNKHYIQTQSGTCPSQSLPLHVTQSRDRSSGYLYPVSHE